MRTAVWVELVPERSPWNPESIWSVRPGRLLKRRPNKLTADTYLVKVEIDVPASVFERKVKVEL